MGEAGRGLFEPLNRFLIPDYLDGVGLSLAGRYEVELGFGTEVLELQTGRPAHVDFLNLLRVELVGGVGTFGGKFYVEAAEVAQHDLVSGEHHLAKTSDGIGQNTLHGTLGEGAVVVGNVLAESVEVENLMNLGGSVGLGLGDVGLLCSGLSAHNHNGIVNHGIKNLRFKFDVDDNANDNYFC